MKYKIYFFILFYAIINNIAFPQFTITSSYMPIIGDTLKTSDVDTTGLTPGESGINVTWNFSNINILSGTPWEEVYLLPSLTPYSGQFPNANIATKNSNSSPDYHYYQNTATDWNMIGYANNNFIKWFTTPYCRFHYPMSYGSLYNSTYKAHNYSGQATRYTTGFRSINVDGYGTLILPGVTYNNVIRVKDTDESFDTVKVGGNVVSTSHTVITNYRWYRTGYKFPIFDYGIAESNTMPSFKYATIAVKNIPVFINQISTTVPDKFNLYQNYPNPFNPNTIIKFQNKRQCLVTLKIFNTIGKEIATLVDETLKPGTYEIPFSINQFPDKVIPSGIYFYKLTAGDFSETKKMVTAK